MSIQFYVPGTPAPGGSKTGFYNKNSGKISMAPASKKTKPWMDTVRAFARAEYEGPLLTCPIHLCIVFQLLRPKGHYGSGRNAGKLKNNAPLCPTTKPDLTKLTRSTEDALKGIIWRDDSAVVWQTIKKMYTERDPGAMIVVEEINGTKE